MRKSRYIANRIYWLALFAAASAGAAELRAAELVMMEQPGCVWCKRFNEEVAPQYGKTREGQLAPLRRVDITEPWPEDLAAVAPERLTPTFVLVHDGRELDRLRGYPGDDFFWGLLGRMLEKVPGHGDTSSTPER